MKWMIAYLLMLVVLALTIKYVLDISNTEMPPVVVQKVYVGRPSPAEINILRQIIAAKNRDAYDEFTRR
jgi:hypothetical protein